MLSLVLPVWFIYTVLPVQPHGTATIFDIVTKPLRLAVLRSAPGGVEDLARKAAADLVRAADPELQAAACDMLGEENGNVCADAPLADARRRRREVAALKEKVLAGDPEALDRLRTAADELMKTDPLLAVESIEALPGDEAAERLQTLMTYTVPEVRRAAAALLPAKAPDAARTLVSRAITGAAPADVGFQAAVGLAKAGDRSQLTQVTAWLPNLHGRDRFQAAAALSANQNSDGTSALVEIARSGDDETLRLEAAEALAESRPEVTAQAVERALASDNVWIRARGAALAAQLGPEWSDRVRRLLADRSPWVRLQAARGVLAR